MATTTALAILHVIALVLASFRVTEAITMDRVSEPFRRRFPHYLWGCPRCVSVWAGAFCTVLYLWVPYLNWAFALSYLFTVKWDWTLSAEAEMKNRVQAEVERRAIQREQRERRYQGGPRPIAGGVGEPWQGIIDPARATDWSTAGVYGLSAPGVRGEPTAWGNCVTAACNTLCGTPQGDGTCAGGAVSTTNIVNALNSADGSSTVVRIPAGSYSLGGFLFSQQNVILRGAGASRTLLSFTGVSPSGCGLGAGSSIRICRGVNANIGSAAAGGAGPQNTANWTGGYAQGTTVITLDSTTNLAVGNPIMLDQTNDAADGYPAAGDIYICDTTTPCSSQGGNQFANTGRAQVQVCVVQSIAGNQVTIEPPLQMPNWRAGQTPQAWWPSPGTVMKNAGLEDVSIDFTPNGAASGLYIINAVNCWTKGIRWLKSDGATSSNGILHVLLLNTVHCTTRDSYFYGPTVQQNIQYAYTPHVSSSLLCENNIFHHNVSPIVPNDPHSGSVIAYNYVDDTFYTGPGIILHNVADCMNLFEGNNESNFDADQIHGTHFFNTFFRNHHDGFPHNSGAADSNASFDLRTHSRFFNLIGNVSGDGHFTSYELDGAAGAPQPGRDTIYNLGWQGDASGTTPPNDPDTPRTLFRWGNWDSVTGTVRFVASENPSAITNFPNLANPSQTFPPSFYLAAQPTTWWRTPAGIPPWPAIGPDVTGGTLTGAGGHANKIPARLCFESLAADALYPASAPRIRTFDRAICYADPTPPPTPTPPGIPPTYGSGLGVRRVGRRTPKWR